jgi:hypothetical protein
MRTLVFGAAMAAICVAMQPAVNQDQVDPQQIIQKFSAKEAEFREARNNYTYRQTVKMEELDMGGNPTGGKWEEVDDIYFSNDKRAEKVFYAPVISLQHILLTPEDVADLRDVQPFVLTTSEVVDYNINYLGREKLDEIGC